MGQSASSPLQSQPQAGSPSAASQSRRRTGFWRRTPAPAESDSSAQIQAPRPRPRLSDLSRPASVNRLSQLLQESVSPPQGEPHSGEQRNPSLTARPARSRHSSYLSGTNSLYPPSENATTTDTRRPRRQNRSLWPSENPAAPVVTTEPGHSRHHITLPALAGPEFDLDFSASGPASQRSSRRSSVARFPSSITDRFSSLRPSRNQSGASTGRRRRSPNTPGEENTVLLSRLLSVAAAATAQTLLEGTDVNMSEATGTASDGDDGTFDGFLQSLESGRLATALRQGTQPGEDGTTSSAPLNFFRMFRFGATAARNPATGPQQQGRMVPIIIVGIRAVQPGGQNSTSDDSGVPPFLEALSSLPTTPLNPSTLGPDFAQPGVGGGARASYRRRRASLGGLNGYDNQRHHLSPEQNRPQSVASELASWPRPPPATPASANLSRVASSTTTTTPPPTVPASRTSSVGSAPRRESIIRTTTTTTLETTTEDAEPRARPTRPRRGSDPDTVADGYSSRRNGIVEPDAPAPLNESTRSWIIYVLGGSYPENHPILTTPSLFTDSPTYEDMMLLSTLLGPAKPPVASETDIASAGGIFQIELATDEQGRADLVAVADDGSERIRLVEEQRCLVCLCDFEKQEEARKLNKCGHLFHKECIDEWLTKGRNSCPLCRSQGVHEHKKEAPPVDSVAPTPVMPSNPVIPAI